MEKVWKEMYYRPAANVEVVFGGSGSSRNQVETIYANLGYVEWLYVKSKKCIAYVGDDTHPYGELKHMAVLNADTAGQKNYFQQRKLPRYDIRLLKMVCVHWTARERGYMNSILMESV